MFPRAFWIGNATALLLIAAVIGAGTAAGWSSGTIGDLALVSMLIGGAIAVIGTLRASSR